MSVWFLLRRCILGICLLSGMLPALKAQVLSPAAQLLTRNLDLPAAQFIPNEQAFLMAVNTKILSPAKAEHMGIQIQSMHGDVWSFRLTAETISQRSLEATSSRAPVK